MDEMSKQNNNKLATNPTHSSAQELSIANRRFRSTQAKTNFVISSVIIVVLLLVIPIVTVYLLSNAYDEQIRLETEKTTSSISHTVRTFINGAYNLSFELSDNPSVLSMDPDITGMVLRNCVERNPYMELIYLTGMDGMQVVRSSGELGDRSERWWFLQIMETRKPFVSKSYYSIATGMPCTAIFIPMYEDAEMIGVFGVDISLDYMQSLVEEFTNTEKGQLAFIIDGEGVVIAHHDSYVLETLTNYKERTRTIPMRHSDGRSITNPDGSVMTVKQDLIITEGFMSVMDDVMNGNSGLEVVEYDGQLYYMGYEPISLPGYSDSWSVITLQDRSIALEVITRLVTQEIVVVTIILIIFIALIATLFRSLSKTLNYLENAKTEADRANKSKSNFLATMSHEIRTPLNAIIGLTQVLLQHKNLPKEGFEALETIYASGNSLLKIINDILDLSKVETGALTLTPEIYDTPSLINDTVQLNIVRIGNKEIDFILDIDENLPFKIRGDSLRVKQILNNLISNAIKYTNEGYVKLSIRHTLKDDKISLCLQVEDTGEGLSPEDQQEVFSEYAQFNTKNKAFIEGTGLGLAITKRLIEMMDGEISVSSTIGEGSVFTATITQEAVDCEPIGKDVAERLAKFTFFDDTNALSLIDYADLHNGKVLVVDDVEINLFVAEAVLSPYNLTIELVTSGAAAIEKIESGKSYDIIFMDHMMPDMDGIETTEKLRKMGYNGTIIALTANALVGNDEMFANHGFDEFIPKPIDIHDLDDVIDRYVKQTE